jgi:hypothetical protein
MGSPRSSLAMVIKLRRVMPSRLCSVEGGEISWPSRTTNTCSALPSLTIPASVSKMASSNPLSNASRRASALFKYPPVGFAREGIALSDVRRQEDTQTSIDSLSMYRLRGSE